jgi:16S rRNA (guanine1207-N2)-methyltransferase
MNPALETIAFALREHPADPGPVLFLGAEPHAELSGIPDLTAWQPLKPLADSCGNAGMNLTEEPCGKFSTVLFLPGKSKDEILAGFARAQDLLAPGGTLVVGLANTAGASRFEKQLSRAAPLLYSVSKNKCRAFAVGIGTPWDEAALGEWRGLAQPRNIPGTDFLTAPGVFSADHIDPGSALLAERLPPSLYGRIADLGAGWGYLSRTALGNAPKISHIDLFEADARALACARHNLPAGAPVSFHWHDVTTGLPEKYDHIITNPPFHSGQAKDVDLGKAFLTVAAASLKRGGTLYLVANRQLPYEAHLESLGLRSRIIAQDHAFKVIFSS